jgi:GNAT superfamily N-acetyltransferase
MTKITFIGARSLGFTSELVRDILTFPLLGDATISLMDINAERLEFSKRVVEKLFKAGNRPAKVEATQRAVKNSSMIEYEEGMVASLQIEFIRTSQVSKDIQKIIDQVDQLAFDGLGAEENTNEWSSSDWMVLGRVEEELVTQLCLLSREIRVGDVPVVIGGVGGVATHPAWQGHGLASTLMRAAAQFMRTDMNVPFGLLICAQKTQPFYARLGWQTVAEELWFTEHEQRRTMQTPVMVIPLSDQNWPEGEIDLCGLPW